MSLFQDASDKKRLICLCFIVSLPLYPLCMLKSLSEDSAVTTLITAMQYRVHGWMKAYM